MKVYAIYLQPKVATQRTMFLAVCIQKSRADMILIFLIHDIKITIQDCTYLLLQPKRAVIKV